MNENFKNFFEQNKNNIFKFQKIPENQPNKVDWILKKSNAPWLEILGIDAPYKEMLEEAKKLKNLFVFHRNEGEGHRGWKSLAFHGISAIKTNVAETYGLKSNEVKYTWTEIKDQCPVTVNFFKNKFPYESYQRVRFMLVEPQGFIEPHSDSPNNFLGSAINISLNNPDNCQLVTTEGTLPFKNEGSMFLFNTHYKHCVYNDSTEDRYHIIVHGNWKKSFNNIVIDSYNKLFN